MFDWILEPFMYPFMVRGLLAAILVGAVCAVIGTYVVLRGMAFLGDALAHAILPGVAVGYLVQGGAKRPLTLWALAAAILSALGIGAISRNSEIKEDTVIGIVFAGAFALGIALISAVRSYAVDLAHFLFGDVLGVQQADLLITGVLGFLVILAVVAFYKEFLVISFDPILAATLRLPARLLDYLMMILIAVTIVISLQTVGVALMVAMLVTPAATAYLLTRKLPVMMILASVIGALSGVVGLIISYRFAIASGAAIVLVCTAIFLVCFLLAPGRGVMWTKFKKSGTDRTLQAAEIKES